MTIFGGIVAASWFIFAAYWAVTAVQDKKNAQGSEHAGAGRWLGAKLLFSIVAFLLVRTAFLSYYTGYYTYHVSHIALQAVGALLCILGVAFAISGRVYLGRKFKLITGGPYTYVRHPIFTGVIVAALGSACVDGGWIILLLVYGAYFLYSAEKEEETMSKAFPKEYPAYKKRTKKLVPFVI